MHIYNWDDWAQKTIPVPMTIGHEFAGVVDAVGDHVRGFARSDLVVGEGHITCGHCRNCLAGWRLLCYSGHRPRIQNRLFVGNGSRRRLIHFELGAHLLDLSGLFFELRGENFHPFLLLHDYGC